MLKSILNLEGVQELKKNEQKAINGGQLGESPDCGRNKEWRCYDSNDTGWTCGCLVKREFA